MVAHRLDHALTERLGALHDLGLLPRHRIAHQRRLHQRIAFRVHLEDGLHARRDRQCEERAQSAEQRAHHQYGEERDAWVEVHRALRDLRRENQVLDLLVHDDEHQHTDPVPQAIRPPGEQHRQRAADIRADRRHELRHDAAEQRQRQPIWHVDNLQENGRAGGVDGGQDGAGEQEAGNLLLHHRPAEQETALRVRSEPLAQAAAHLRARGRNIVRHHQHGQQIQQEAEHAHRGGQRLTGEIGDPRRLHVLEYLHAEVLYLRHVERRVLLHRVHDLRVYRRKPLHHGDQLLHEHVAEQREQSHDDHGEADQAHRRREAALPAVSHHRDHQRLDLQKLKFIRYL